jgi:hypothetical protein
MLRPQVSEAARSAFSGLFFGGGVDSSASTSASVHSRRRPRTLVRPDVRVFHWRQANKAFLSKESRTRERCFDFFLNFTVKFGGKIWLFWLKLLLVLAKI